MKAFKYLKEDGDYTQNNGGQVYPSSITTTPAKTNYNIEFYNDSNLVGRLSWDEGKLVFEGQAEISAKIFFDFLKSMVDKYIKERLGEKS